MDFGSWLSTDETIASITSVAVTGDGDAVTVSSQVATGSRVTFFVEGGTATVRYAVTVTILTSSGQILIAEGPLKVVA